MLSLARASALLSLMPKRLKIKEITKRECEELWSFANSNDRLSISQQMLKVNLADECGVMVERLLEVLDDSPFIEALVMEAGEEASTYSLREATEVMRNAHLNKGWILPFCRSISVQESYFIWRWATGFYWLPQRNRFLKWIKLHSKLNGDYPVDVHLSVIFDGLKITNEIKPFPKLQAWDGGVPKKWWFITDCGTLKYIGGGVVRNRNGSLNTTLTPLLNSDVECWLWDNPTGTGYWHSADVVLPFSKYKNPMTHEWHESQILLESYSKGGFLIEHFEATEYKEHKKSSFYLMSKGTNVLFAQVLSVRNMDKGGYEIVIGFNDAGEIVDTTTYVMAEMPFTLDSALRRRGVNVNVRYAYHTVTDCLVAKFIFTWTPTQNWHLKFVDVEDSMGISDVNDILDYYAIVGGEDES